MTENEISNLVFDAGMKVHRKLGVGLYESVYEKCLVHELKIEDSMLKVKKI